MAVDLAKLSDADLEALQKGDLSKVSDEGLAHLSGQPLKKTTALDTVGQYAGVANRALAPYVAAAGAGAIAGAPIGGIGAIPGAALGAAALGLTDLGATAYNAVATPFGATRLPTGSEVIQQGAEQVGIGSRPQTGAQRVFGTAVESAAGAGGLTRAANQLASTVTSPVAQGTFNAMGRNLGPQMVSGAASGGTVATAQNAGVDNPYALALLGVLGGGAPYLGAVTGKGLLRAGANVGEGFMPSGQEAIKARAYLEALGNDTAKLNEAINLLRQGLTVEQVATKMGSTGLAALSGTARYATPNVRDIYLTREQATQQGQANRLAGASANLEQLQQGNALVGEQQQAAIARQQNQLAATIPNPSQLKVGEAVSGVREQALKQAQDKIVTPAYNAAFAASPDTVTFSFAPVESAAMGIRGKTATVLNPEQAPYTSDVLRLYRTEPADTYTSMLTQGQPKPAMVSLRGADEFVKAINQDMAALSGVTDGSANATLRNLMQLKTAALGAVESGVTPEAKALYDQARNLYQTKVAIPFKEGWLANFEREGATGVPIQNLEKVSSTVLGSEDKALRFVAALGDRPDAMDAISRGIEGEYRTRVVKNGIVDPKAHDNFMAKYGKSLSVMDDAGLSITSKLDDFGAKAKALEAQGLSAAEIASTQAADIAEAQTTAQRAMASLTSSNITPQQSATQLSARLQSLPEVRAQIDAIRAELRDAKFFDRLAREGVKAGGGVKGMATTSMGKAPHMLSHASMLANYVLARLGGKLDAKLAGEVAADMLNSEGLANVLERAPQAAARGKVMRQIFKPTPKPSLEQMGVTNLLAPANNNALVGQ